MRKLHAWVAIPVGAAVIAVLSAGVPAQAELLQRDYAADLRGANEVPGPGDPNGKGEFVAITTKDTLCYALSARKIATATASHIHAGTSDVAGDIVVTLITATKQGVAGCITAVPDADDTTLTLSDTELKGIRNNSSAYYVNVHNAKYPAGAIRGQLAS